MTAPRNLPLDGYRGISLSLVLLWHYMSSPELTSSGFIGAFARSLALTWGGVDLFFILSGYLITEILWRSRQAENQLTVFFARRAVRLLPLYALLLVSFLLARAWLGDRPIFGHLLENPAIPLAWYPLFLQNLPMAYYRELGVGWLLPTWSLAVEIQFYLLFPPFVRNLSRRHLMLLLGLLPFFAFALRTQMPIWSAYVSLPTRVDSFAIGGLIALATQDADFVARYARFRFLWRMLLLLGVPVCVAWAWLPFLTGGVSWVYHPLTHSGLAVWGGLLLLQVLVFPEGRCASLMSWSVARQLGLWAYAAYLFHQPIIRVLFGLIQDREPHLGNMSGRGLTLLALGLTLALSALLFVCLERPCIRWGQRFQYHYPQPRTPEPDSVPLTQSTANASIAHQVDVSVATPAPRTGAVYQPEANNTTC